MTLQSKISEMLDEFMLEQEGVEANYWGDEPVNKVVAQLLALFEKEMGKIIGKDENLYEKERKQENWDWRVQREEGGNELRHSQRAKLAKVMEGKV